VIRHEHWFSLQSQCNALLTLIARCAIRDQTALKELFELLGGYLHAVAYRIVRSEELSNEVLQDAFVQIWDNAGSYRADLARPLTWMTSILRYRALDQLARERKHSDRCLPNGEGDILEQLAGQDNPEGRVHDSQVQTYLVECLAALSERMRRSVLLAYLEGYSREDIAGLFNTNTNTVKSWLHRGAERLRKCLEARINP
jgi:RNA polymerase sigma-70 factor (ECF subfamily)